MGSRFIKRYGKMKYQEYSDNEEMDQESEKSSCSSDTSYPSDSEDSSELDMEECSRRRLEILEHLAEVEKQFVQIREQLYREKMLQVNSKLKEVKDGTASEFKKPFEEFQVSLRSHIEVAGIQKKYRLLSAQTAFEAEVLACKQHFENEKALLLVQLTQKIEKKIHGLEEEMASPEIEPEEKPETTTGRQTRRAAKKAAAAASKSEKVRRKLVTVTKPFIIYQLPDSEILEDWTVIKKSLSGFQRRPLS